MKTRKVRGGRGVVSGGKAAWPAGGGGEGGGGVWPPVRKSAMGFIEAMNSAMSSEPAPDHWRLVSGEVIKDQVDA